MAIDLSDFEAGTPFHGDYERTLEELQQRLSRAVVAHIVHDRSSVIVVEGWNTSGKGGVIQRLNARSDPRAIRVWPIGAPTTEERGRHFLWRFWTRLPGPGEIAIFDRSWYGRVLVERVDGLASQTEWFRAYDEINEFEAQLVDHGTTVVKLFLHITQSVQDERLRARLDHPWKRWKVSPDDFRNRDRRASYVAAVEEMFSNTNTRWSPWHVIDAIDKKAARIAALTAVADALERVVPMDPPPLRADVEALARDRLGVSA